MINSKRYSTAVKLRKMIGWDQAEYTPEEARRLISDWIILDEVISANQEEIRFSDYSFAMAPMYKTVEVVLWEIAKDLKLVRRGEQLGAFFNEENIESIFPKIKSKVKDKKLAKQIQNQLHELKNTLMRYGHNPAHAGFRFGDLEEERLAASSALHNIRCLVQDLLAAGLLKKKKKSPAEIASLDNDINPDNIPF